MMNQSGHESDKLSLQPLSHLFKYETLCDLATESPRFYDLIFTYVSRLNKRLPNIHTRRQLKKGQLCPYTSIYLLTYYFPHTLLQFLHILFQRLLCYVILYNNRYE